MIGRVLVFATLLSSAATAYGQQTVSGIVRDASGAVVPGATVIVRQPNTNFEPLVESGRDGRFVISQAESGDYAIEVVAPGFAAQRSCPHTLVGNHRSQSATGSGDRGRANRICLAATGVARIAQH